MIGKYNYNCVCYFISPDHNNIFCLGNWLISDFHIAVRVHLTFSAENVKKKEIRLQCNRSVTVDSKGAEKL